MNLEQGQTMNLTSGEDFPCADAGASNSPFFEATRSKGESPLSCGSHLGPPNRRPRWFCIETHHRAELLAVLQLMRQQFTVHCPKLRVWRAGKPLVPEVMFPGYLFVQFDRDVDHWRPIVSTRGVKRFMAMRDVLPLIGRMHAEVLAEVSDKPDTYAAYLAQAEPGIEVAFTRLLSIGQPWERALESLDAFLGTGAAKAEATPAPRKAKRLVWFLDPETRTIEVAEQSAKARDGWSDGRPVALKRLHDRDPRLDYLTNQERGKRHGGRTLRHMSAV
jgi:hypothetical protein